MSLMLKKDTYPYFETTGFESTECSVDAEYFLPDYCPDIQKILKCTADVQIISDSLSQDRLSVQGNLSIIVMYTDEKSDSIRNCELTKEFTANVKVSCDPENTLTYLKTACGHIICRAVSARKLDIHIPVLINYSFCSLKEAEIVTDAVNAEKKEMYVNASKALRLIKKDTSISQNLELSGSMKPIESILRKDIEFINIKAVPFDDKVEVSATAEVTVIYRSYSENSAVEKLKYQVPFNESIEITGCERDFLLRCDINKGELSLQPKEDGMGDNTVISLYTKFTINLCLYTQADIRYIPDAYPLNYRSVEKYTKQIFRTYESKEISTDISAEITTDNLEKVIDIWCDGSEVLAFSEQNKINFRGKFTANILYINQDKKVCFINKTVDFNSQLNFGGEKQVKCISFVKAKVNEFKIVNSNSVKIDFNILIDSFTELSESVNMLVSSEIGDEYTLESGKLNIIYSGKNTTLWDIAKKHRVAVSEILEINSFESEDDISFPLMLYKK